MQWFYLTILSVFIVSIANILEKVLMRDHKSDPVSYTIIFCFIIGIFNALFALVHGFSLPPLDYSLIYLCIASLFWAIGTVLVFKSLQLLESSEVIIVTSLRALITICASVLFLHETFTFQRATGTVLIVGSVLLVTHMKKGFTFNKGLMYALGSTLFTGLAVVFDAHNVKTYDPVSYLVIENFLMALLLLIAYPKVIQQLPSFANKSFLKKMVALSFFSFLQAIVYFYALSIGPASQIAPINQAQVIVTVLLAALLLQERDHIPAKISASVLVIVGIILLH